MSINDRIRSVGLKATPQRREIYEVVSKLEHATIEEIIKELHSGGSKVTISTVYRILNSFCESNLLGRINHPNGKIYYDINTHEHHHIFTPKESLIDISDPQLTELIRQRIIGQIGDDQQIEKISIQITTKLKD